MKVTILLLLFKNPNLLDILKVLYLLIENVMMPWGQNL